MPASDRVFTTGPIPLYAKGASFLMSSNFFSSQFFAPDHVMRRVVKQFAVHVVAFFSQSFNRDQCKHQTVSESEIRSVMQAVPKQRRFRTESLAIRQKEDAVLGMLHGLGE